MTGLPTPGSPDVWGAQLLAALGERSRGGGLLTPSTPDDHFTAGALSGWSVAGSYVAGDYTLSESWLLVSNGRAAGNYFYQAAPAGDFTVTMRAFAVSSAAAMFGIIIVDATGAGIGAGFYNSSPNGPLLGNLSGGVYASSGFNNSSAPLGTTMAGGDPCWYRVRKVGSTYNLSVSLNGLLWGPEIAHTPSFTPARVGFGSFLGTAAQFGVDLFDVA